MRETLSLICVLACVGGIVLMKIVFARKAARARDISIIEAAATTAWVRDEQGRFRWVVVGWLLFWLTATELVIRFVR